MIPSKIDQKFHHLWHMIGNTPMLEISYRYNNEPGRIFVKCEHYNLTGSIKDRMALYVLQQTYKHEAIHPGTIIVEATSGNTGISFAAIGRSLGHQVRIIMPDWLSKERMDIIRSLGAEVILVSKQEGGFLGSIDLSKRMAADDPNVFLPCQFDNKDNAEAHEKTTAKEIWVQLHSINLIPDAFIAGVGTGGTVMGVGRYLKTKHANIKIHPLEPAESPTLSCGKKVGSHRIQGISDEFIPSIVHLNELDQIVQAHDGDSILMAQKVAKQLGLAVGISSGANVIGAIKTQHQMGADAVVVTVLSDSNKKYLSTDLLRFEESRPDYLTPHVEFIEYNPIHRL